jgi:hypothetical protein
MERIFLDDMHTHTLLLFVIKSCVCVGRSSSSIACRRAAAAAHRKII